MSSPFDRDYTPPVIESDPNAVGARKAMMELAASKAAAGAPRSNVFDDALKVARRENWSRG